MTRVLHVISGIDPEHGGPTTALLGMTKAQVKVGLQVALASTWMSPTARASADAFRASGVHVTMIGPAKDPMCRHRDITPTLGKLIAEADVVHVHGVWEQIQHDACRLARKRRVPYIVTPHGMLSEWNMAVRPWRKKLYLSWRLRADLDGAARLHFTTDAERRSVAPLGLKAMHVVVPLGIDFDEFDLLPTAGRFRAKHPELVGKRIVLFLGRLDRKKGLDLLIPAFARADLPDTTLVLAGPDSSGYGRQMLDLAAREGIAARVLFTGMLRGVDRVEALVDADVFALTSYTENFGVAVVEALAAGTPVLISDQVQVGERLREPGMARVVDLSIDRIAGALREMVMESDGRLATLTRDTRAAIARREFDWGNAIRPWMSIYSDCVDSNAAS